LRIDPHKLLDIWDRWARSSSRKLWILLFVAALIVRIIYGVIEPNPYQGLIKGEIIADATEYDMIARNLAQGGGFGYYPGEPTAFRNPLLPFLIAGVYVITGIKPIVAQFLIILMGALIPPVLFASARQVVEPASALLAATAAVFYPPLVIFSVSTMSEVPFILLLLLALLCWHRFLTVTRGEWHMVVWAGVFVGLALLTRSTIAPLIGLWALYLLIDGGKERWRHLLRFAVFCLVVIATLTPWFIRNYHVFREWSWITTNGGFNLWHRHNLLPPDGTLFSRQDIQQELQRIYRMHKDRIAAGEDPVEVGRPFLAQTVRGYIMRLGPEEEEYVRGFDGLSEVDVDRRLFQEAVTAIQRYPVRAAIKIVKNTIKYWDPYHDPDLIYRYRRYNLAYGIMVPFMLWGLYLSWLQRRRFMLFYLIIVSFWAITAVLIMVGRFRLPVETIGMIFAASAVVSLFRRPGKPCVPWLILGAVIAVNIIIMVAGGPVLQSIRESLHAIR
jgi:4-amino-4-deoxy-L-arabinose transferase-like glycosyltransferase